MDTSTSDSSPEVELENRRFLKGQISLRLIFYKTFFFAICFGFIRNYLHPYWLDPIKDAGLYYAGWTLVAYGVWALYMCFLFGRKNIIEDPRGWWEEGRVHLTLLAFVFAIYAAIGSVFLQIFLL